VVEACCQLASTEKSQAVFGIVRVDACLRCVSPAGVHQSSALETTTLGKWSGPIDCGRLWSARSNLLGQIRTRVFDHWRGWKSTCYSPLRSRENFFLAIPFIETGAEACAVCSTGKPSEGSDVRRLTKPQNSHSAPRCDQVTDTYGICSCALLPRCSTQSARIPA
jgi:hypothetical protein